MIIIVIRKGGCKVKSVGLCQVWSHMRERKGKKGRLCSLPHHLVKCISLNEWASESSEPETVHVILASEPHWTIAILGTMPGNTEHTH